MTEVSTDAMNKLSEAQKIFSHKLGILQKSNLPKDQFNWEFTYLCAELDMVVSNCSKDIIYSVSKKEADMILDSWRS